VSLALAVFVVAWYAGRMQRQYKDWEKGEWERFLHVGKIAFGGWALHYRKLLHARRLANIVADRVIVPFLVMGRVTYLHHYVREPTCLQMLSKLTWSSYRHYGSQSFYPATY